MGWHYGLQDKADLYAFRANGGQFFARNSEFAVIDFNSVHGFLQNGLFEETHAPDGVGFPLGQ